MENQYIKNPQQSFPGKGLQTPMDDELTKSNRENLILMEERDILKHHNNIA